MAREYIWKSGEDWRYLLDELKEDFKRHVCEYAGRWRVKISIMKTEFCVFSLDNHIRLTSGLPGAVYDVRLKLNVLLVK